MTLCFRFKVFVIARLVNSILPDSRKKVNNLVAYQQTCKVQHRKKRVDSQKENLEE